MMTTPLDSTAARYAMIKAQHPDTIVLFRVGDFYEAYSADALVIAAGLGLPRRERDGVPMAAFPRHNLEIYVNKLVSDGHRVTLCEEPTPLS